MTMEGASSGGLSRRALLRRAGVVGAAAAVPAGILASDVASAPERERLETFTAAEADTVDAMLGRLIPADESGPGAIEARVLRYVDRRFRATLRSRVRRTPPAWLDGRVLAVSFRRGLRRSDRFAAGHDPGRDRKTSRAAFAELAGVLRSHPRAHALRACSATRCTAAMPTSSVGT